MRIGKYSFGIGDRFGHQGEAQLKAIIKAEDQGLDISPVWNKSNREHSIIGSTPIETMEEADNAVKNLNWGKSYFVDADHINMKNVDAFIPHSNFFTIDVAGNIGLEPLESDAEEYKKSCRLLGKSISIPGIQSNIEMSDDILNEVSRKYLSAVKEAGKIYRHIEKIKGFGNFVTEISMDEVESPQSPVELFFILKMIADEKIPVQTIAPKFTGRFNKGVEYVGDLNMFSKEFEEDLLTIDYAVKKFNLPEDLKLSIHSGSDKFSIYPIIGDLIRKYDKGIHVKTAGTTWLEEVIGLAVADGEGLEAAKEIYRSSFSRQEELCELYSDVIDIDFAKLPSPDTVDKWSSEKFADSLRHISEHPDYDPNFRQLLHVGYKVAAEMGEKYRGLLKKFSSIIGECVEENIYDRHLKRLFKLS